MSEPRFAPASVRNCEPILRVLTHEFANCRQVLEIGSGAGYHATAFAAALPHLVWQASELPDALDAVRGNVRDAGHANLAAPVALDVRTDDVPGERFDAVFSSNTAHIMAPFAVERMLKLVCVALAAGGVFCYYGPFRRGGEHNAASNAEFDRALRLRDPDSGIRELEHFDALMQQCGMRRLRTWAMPANNLLVVWRRSAGCGAG